MLIILKSNAKLKLVKIYLIKSKKRLIINVTFDKIHANDKITWVNQSTLFNFSIFVVWRETLNDFKNTIVINTQELNKVIESNIYFMFLQFNITSIVANLFYTSIVNTIDWFYQFNVKISNRFKFIVVLHKKQK